MGNEPTMIYCLMWYKLGVQSFTKSFLKTQKGNFITWHEEIFTVTCFSKIISQLFQPASVF